MSRRRGRKAAQEEPEEHVNHERWLVSYADMVTVLFALFVVLFAISVVDQGKFVSLKASLSSSFGQKITVLEGAKAPAAGESARDGVLDMGSALLPPTSPEVGQLIERAVAESKAKDALAAADRQRHAVEREVESLEKTRRAIVAALAKKNLVSSVQFRYDSRGLVISVITEKILFAPDRASLSPSGKQVLRAVAPVLRKLPNELLVEGHTNLVPVKPKFYPTEWELSGARATTVVRHLIDVDRISAKRLSSTGYADQRPLIPGTGAKANRVNRRVELVVVSTLAPQDRALLPIIAPSVTQLGKE